MSEFRSREDGTHYPVSKARKTRYKRAYYTVKEERYFDCPKCGNQISDDSPNDLCLQSTDSDECAEISKGSIGKCPYCGTTIKIAGGA